VVPFLNTIRLLSQNVFGACVYRPVTHPGLEHLIRKVRGKQAFTQLLIPERAVETFNEVAQLWRHNETAVVHGY
jgi:hypothetical protein